MYKELRYRRPTVVHRTGAACSTNSANVARHDCATAKTAPQLELRHREPPCKACHARSRTRQALSGIRHLVRLHRGSLPDQPVDRLAEEVGVAGMHLVLLQQGDEQASAVQDPGVGAPWDAHVEPAVGADLPPLDPRALDSSVPQRIQRFRLVRALPIVLPAGNRRLADRPRPR